MAANLLCIAIDGADACMPNVPVSCAINQTCLAVGVAGRYTCVNRKFVHTVKYISETNKQTNTVCLLVY